MRARVIVVCVLLGAAGGFLVGFPIARGIAGLVVGAIGCGALGYVLFSATSYRNVWWVAGTLALSGLVVVSYVDRADVLRDRVGRSEVAVAGETQVPRTTATTTAPTTTAIPLPEAGIVHSETNGLPPDAIRWAFFQNANGDGVATVAILDATKIDQLPSSGQFRIVAGRVFEGGSTMESLDSFRALSFDELRTAGGETELRDFDWADPASYNWRLCSPSFSEEALEVGQRHVVYAMVFDSRSNALVYDEYLVLERGQIDIEALESFETMTQLVNPTRCAPDDAFIFVD